MLLGYAMGETDEWQEIDPYGDIAGLDAALIGKLDRIIEKLAHYAQLLGRPATPAQWVDRLRALMDDFLAPPDDLAGFTLEQLAHVLDTWLTHCTASDFDEVLPVEIVAQHWFAAFQQGNMAQRFSSGAITFATLMPMRAIPFKHVYLLGMNDGDYPRPRTVVQFDLMERDYRPGDRSRRDDDRYLFLEALLSARDRFYVSWVGRSIVDNTARPPSVLVGQLRDHLEAGWCAADGSNEVLRQVTTDHPLQAFSPAYFEGSSANPALFTYAKEWRVSHPSMLGSPTSNDASLLTMPVRDEPLSVQELRVFLEHPVREFFRQRLQVRAEEGDAPPDEERFVADGLDTWQLHDALIRTARPLLEKNENPRPACDAMLARMLRAGELAYGGAGELQRQRGRGQLAPVFAEFGQWCDEWPFVTEKTFELRHDLQTTPGIVAWLSGLRQNADGECLRLEMQATQLTNRENQWRDEKMLAHWVLHLLANAADLSLTTVVISPAGTAKLRPTPAAQARNQLDAMLLAWQEGLRRPLPIKAEFARPVLTAMTRHGLSAAKDLEGWRTLAQSQPLLTQLTKCFEKVWNQAHRTESIYESRAYPTLDSLIGSGELVKWAVELYEPLFSSLRAERK